MALLTLFMGVGLELPQVLTLHMLGCLDLNESCGWCWVVGGGLSKNLVKPWA